jgi:ubiquinone/menaquinone biosynthesis C-methylase UbiE
MNIQEAYTRWSDTYDSDRNLTRDLDHQATLHALTGLRYQNIMELGCGTGKNTAFLTQIASHIFAVDFSSGMLRQAKAKIRSDRVFFVVADVTKQWPCKDETFELIVCNLVLEHIEDLSAVFAQVSRALKTGGQFFLSELHPFRQYKGTKANFQSDNEAIEIHAFVHHLSDFTESARANGLSLQMMKEWWHEEDQNKPPRLVSFIFEKSGARPRSGPATCEAGDRI